MGKILTLVLVIAAVYLAVKLMVVLKRKAECERAGGAAQPPSSSSPPGGVSGKGQGSASQAQPMVQCAGCGVFLPSTDALMRAGQTYCCVEHRDAGH